MKDKTKNLKINCFRPINYFNLNFAYVTFSVFSILYSIFTIRIFSLTIFPTINKITYTKEVQWGITDSLQHDLLISSIFLAISVVFFFKKSIGIPIAALVFGFSILGAIDYDNFSVIGSIFFVGSFPFIISLIFLNKFYSWKLGNDISVKILQNQSIFNTQNFLKILFIVFVIFESMVLISWIIHPVIQNFSSEDMSLNFTLLETNLFYSFGLLSPILLLLCMFSFVLKPSLNRINNWFNKYFYNEKQKIKKLDNHDINKNNNVSKLSNQDKLLTKKTTRFFDSKFKQLLLVFLVAILPSILITLYPYSISEPQFSSGPSLPGVLGYDFFAYKESIDSLVSSSNDVNLFLSTMFVEIDHGSRPLSIFSIYLLYLISGDQLEKVLTFLPSIIGPFLVLSVFFFMRTAYPSNPKLAIISSIMTAVSHQIVIGFYGGLYSNWMGLSVMFASSIFFIKCFQNTKNLSRNIVLFAVFAILVMLFHNFLWAYFITVLVFLLVWSTIQKILSKKNLRIIFLLSLTIGGIIIIDVVKSELTDSIGGFERNFGVAVMHGNITEPQKIWENLEKAFHNYMGGFLTNSMVLLLLFIWTLKADYTNISDKFFLSMLFVALIPVLFSDFIAQSRLVYIIPIQIPASIIMYRIYKNTKISFGKPLFFAILLMQFNYAFRSMANMNFQLPEV